MYFDRLVKLPRTLCFYSSETDFSRFHQEAAKGEQDRFQTKLKTVEQNNEQLHAQLEASTIQLVGFQVVSGNCWRWWWLIQSQAMAREKAALAEEVQKKTQWPWDSWKVMDIIQVFFLLYLVLMIFDVGSAGICMVWNGSLISTHMYNS